MKAQINEEVSVVAYYSAKQRVYAPYLLSWDGKEYPMGKIDYYHTYMEGQERQHVFELCDKDASLWFRLRLNSLNLHWILEAVHDGLAD